MNSAQTPSVSGLPSHEHPQFTLRAGITGVILGGVMCLSNLYVGLKTGWGFGAAITTGILCYSLFAFFFHWGWTRTKLHLLETSTIQSIASAAGYTMSGGNIAAIPAYMMISHQNLTSWHLFLWVSSTALLGVVMAIPMKYPFIHREKLRFPTGVAAAATLITLYEEGSAQKKITRNFLGCSSAIGAIIGFLRDFEKIPERFSIPGILLQGRPLIDYTLALDTSALLIAGGAIMGLRTTGSMLLGSIINYGILSPFLYRIGIISPDLGYKNIVSWSVWLGSSLLLSSAVTSLLLEGRKLKSTLGNLTSFFRPTTPEKLLQQIPTSWFLLGLCLLGPCVIALEKLLFSVPIFIGTLSILLSFFLALVACRTMGETDITPTGALGKVAQLIFGILAPGHTLANLMTACAACGAGLHAADLLTDFKRGSLVKANPKKQFFAQVLGILAGSIIIAPAFHLLLPHADLIGTDQWPAPAAQTWKSVAVLMAQGLSGLQPSHHYAIGVGILVGIGLILLETRFPRFKRWIPSAASLGMGFTIPGSHAISFFLGALLAAGFTYHRPILAQRSMLFMSSGLIAGESLMGILMALFALGAH